MNNVEELNHQNKKREKMARIKKFHGCIGALYKNKSTNTNKK